MKNPCKVQAIQEVPEPQNVMELKSFLGLVNYYRKFIPDMSFIVHLLNRLLTFHAPWSWMNACQEALKNLKKLLLDSPLLARYDPDQVSLGWTFYTQICQLECQRSPNWLTTQLVVFSYLETQPW